MLVVIILVVVAALAVGVYYFMKGMPVSEAAGKPKTQQQIDTEHVQRLCYLLKIVLEYSSTDRKDSSTREVVRIGETVHQQGGFRYMLKIHEAVTEKTSPKIGAKLKASWKGIGDWRA